MADNIRKKSFIRRFLGFSPVFIWGSSYSYSNLRSDAVAALVVLFITVPQSIAYAYLAGMPASAGLYAAIGGLFFYGLFGTSRALAVGPTAIIAMMSLETVSRLAEVGTAEYVSVSLKLALLTGLILIFLRLVKFGSITSFLSHAVITGFITAAAVLIIFNQFPAVLGMGASSGTSLAEVSGHLLRNLGDMNRITLGLALIGMVILAYCRFFLTKHLGRSGISENLAANLARSAPMYAVLVTVLLVFLLELDTSGGVAVVGSIPTSLPSFSALIPGMEEMINLFPSALLISMVVFMESTAIGTAIASKTRTKLDSNQELVGLGMANIGSSFLGGFPVAGSFARSIITHSSGASTPAAALITAFFVLITLVWFSPLFFYLPKGVLSIIIVMSAAQLIDLSAVRKIFSFNPVDAVTFSFTFLAVLVLGVETGILVGILISFVLLIRNSSMPHIAIVGRIQGTEHFRNIERYDVITSPRVIAIRIDESLYFVNTRYVENFVLNKLAELSEVRHVLLICSSTNFIDTSGLEFLEEMSHNLEEAGVTLHLAEVKGPVMDRLKNTSFYENMKGKIFFTTDMAMKELGNI